MAPCTKLVRLPVKVSVLTAKVSSGITLQRRFSALTKFARVESRLFGLKRQRKAIFYTSITLVLETHFRRSVVVGIIISTTSNPKTTVLPVTKPKVKTAGIVKPRVERAVPGSALHVMLFPANTRK
jgi:hypothetical protein